MTLRIGVDIDGVCYEWEKTARYMLREILPNSPYTKSGPLGELSQSWDYIEDNVSEKHWKWLWKEGVELGLFRHGHLFPGTIKALNKLDTMGRLVAITQRPTRASEDTFAWINFHRLPFKEVHVLQGGSKTQVQRLDAFIDDRPSNCAEVKAAWPACAVALPHRPWNAEWPSYAHAVERVAHWEEFIEMVKMVRDRQ